jgi:hypothetical protein
MGGWGGGGGGVIRCKTLSGFVVGYFGIVISKIQRV